MAESLYGLTEEQTIRVKKLLSAWEGGRFGQKEVDATPLPRAAVGSYLAKTVDAIDAKTTEDGEDTPGVGEAELFWLTSEGILESLETTVEVMNATDMPIPAGVLVTVIREPHSGKYMCFSASGFAHVMVTSHLPDQDSGYYPAIVQVFDVDIGEWADDQPCWFLPANDDNIPPGIGRRYLAKSVGFADPIPGEEVGRTIYADETPEPTWIGCLTAQMPAMDVDAGIPGSGPVDLCRVNEDGELETLGISVTAYSVETEPIGLAGGEFEPVYVKLIREPVSGLLFVIGPIAVPGDDIQDVGEEMDPGESDKYAREDHVHALQIDCGLAWDEDVLNVDLETLVGPGLRADTTGECDLIALNPGCGIRINNDGETEIYVSDIVGDVLETGLEPGFGADCNISINQDEIDGEYFSAVTSVKLEKIDQGIQLRINTCTYQFTKNKIGLLNGFRTIGCAEHTDKIDCPLCEDNVINGEGHLAIGGDFDVVGPSAMFGQLAIGGDFDAEAIAVFCPGAYSADTFTDTPGTALASHTPEVGTWSVHDATGSTYEIVTAGPVTCLEHTGAGNNTLNILARMNVGTNDHKITTQVLLPGVNFNMGIMARGGSALSSNVPNDAIWCIIQEQGIGGPPNFGLAHFVSGVGSFFPGCGPFNLVTGGGTYTLEVICNGSTVTFNIYLSGSLLHTLSASDSTTGTYVGLSSFKNTVGGGTAFNPVSWANWCVTAP